MIVTTFDSTKLFFDMWIRHHRMLQFIVIDRDTKFMVGFWKQLFKKVGMKLSFNMTL